MKGAMNRAGQSSEQGRVQSRGEKRMWDQRGRDLINRMAVTFTLRHGGRGTGRGKACHACEEVEEVCGG
jgi:hypothetical protein